MQWGASKMANPDLVNALLAGAETWNSTGTGEDVLNFDNADLTKIESMQGCHFGKRASFVGAKFDLLRFPDSSFQGGADFTDAVVLGETYIVSSRDRTERLVLERVTFHG